MDAGCSGKAPTLDKSTAKTAFLAETVREKRKIRLT